MPALIEGWDLALSGFKDILATTSPSPFPPFHVQKFAHQTDTPRFAVLFLWFLQGSVGTVVQRGSGMEVHSLFYKNGLASVARAHPKVRCGCNWHHKMAWHRLPAHTPRLGVSTLVRSFFCNLSGSLYGGCSSNYK